MAQSITNEDDFIDARDVAVRIAEIEGQIDDATPDMENELPTDEEFEELTSLRKLTEQIKNSASDARCATLVRDSAMPDYVKQCAEDVKGIDTTKWPFDCIDWQEAVDDFVRYDWNEIDFEGQKYWVRA